MTKSKGIRISDADKKNDFICVQFPEILNEIEGESLYWSILELDVIGNLGEGRSVPLFQKEIKKS